MHLVTHSGHTFGCSSFAVPCDHWRPRLWLQLRSYTAVVTTAPLCDMVIWVSDVHDWSFESQTHPVPVVAHSVHYAAGDDLVQFWSLQRFPERGPCVLLPAVIA